jgi:single-strand DNA-binding protein
MFLDAPVYLAGFLTSDPKFKKVGDDISSAKLRVAYTARRRDRETGEWTDGATTFVNVQCWRQLADNVTTCLRKGEPVLVMGRLRIRSYNDAEGKTRTAVEVEANSVGHDLTRGMAHFSRALRSAGGRPEAVGGHGVTGQDLDGGLDEADQPPGRQDGAVLDEEAVAEFARELSALGGDTVAGAETEAAETEAAETEPAETEPAVDAEAEPAASPQS